MRKTGFFRGCDGLDERQLLLRGNVYKHMMIVLMALLLVNGFLKAEGVTWAEGMYENLLIFWAAVGVGLVEFILLDINPRRRGMNMLYIFLGICGAMLLILGAGHVLVEHKPLVEDGMLNTLGAGLIQAFIMFGVCLLFIGRRLYNRHRPEEE